MANIARIGDAIAGTCVCHKSPKSVSGVIIAGASKTTIEGAPTSRVGDICVASCGHSAVIVSSSDTVTNETGYIARAGDTVAGCVNGVIISGASITTNTK